jgi:hypothetical protein
MVYLTHYEEYPIYEPAEGGYYYAGIQMVESKKLSKRAAKRLFKELWEQLKEENFQEYGEQEPVPKSKIYPWVYSCYNQPKIIKSSYYIGEGEYFVIERNKGKDVKGYEPYC